MSLAAMQSALAMLVRYPGAFHGEELTALLADPDLTAGEKESLTGLAANRELGKFGFGIQDMRWSIITVRLPLVQRVVATETLFSIFVEEFEPVASRIANADLALAYLSFLEEDAAARACLAEAAPPQVWDFIRFEKAQLLIERDRWHGLPAPDARSPLTTRAIYLCAFETDLPGYLQALEAGNESAEPARRATWALLLGTEYLPGYRLFALDEETHCFLRIALDGGTPGFRPASYPDLVAAGVCRETEA